MKRTGILLATSLVSYHKYIFELAYYLTDDPELTTNPSIVFVMMLEIY